MFGRICILAGLLGATATSVAWADTSGTAGDVPLDLFKPAMDSRGYFTVNASQVLGDKDVSFGLGALDWGHGLLKLGNFDNCKASSGAACYRVNDILTATLIGAVGLHIGPADLEFGVSVPVVIMGGEIGRAHV